MIPRKLLKSIISLSNICDISADLQCCFEIFLEICRLFVFCKMFLGTFKKDFYTEASSQVSKLFSFVLVTLEVI